jgi:uncharacterized protein
MKALYPYMDAYWGDHFTVRGSHLLNFQMSCTPANAPISARPDWRSGTAPPGSDLTLLQSAMDQFRTRLAICNCIHWGGRSKVKICQL